MKPNTAWLVPVVLLSLIATACTADQATHQGSGVGVRVGQAAPEFTLPSARSSKVSLSEFEGKDILLYFSMGPG